MTYLMFNTSKLKFPAIIEGMTLFNSIIETIFLVSLANGLESLVWVFIADLVAIRDKEFRLGFRHITCDFKFKQNLVKFS